MWKGLTPFATHLTLKYALRMGTNATYQSLLRDEVSPYYSTTESKAPIPAPILSLAFTTMCISRGRRWALRGSLLRSFISSFKSLPQWSYLLFLPYASALRGKERARPISALCCGHLGKCCHCPAMTHLYMRSVNGGRSVQLLPAMCACSSFLC